MDDEPGSKPEPFEALKARGVGPAGVYAEARRRGLPAIEGVRLLRGLYALPFDEAREISWEVDGYPDHLIPRIRTHADLVAALTRELGYCGCAYAEAAVDLLREALELAKERSDTFGGDRDDATWAKVDEALRASLHVEAAPGLATWFLYFLDHRGFVEHAGNVMGCWITQKGLRLLDGLREHSRPPDDPEGDEDS